MVRIGTVLATAISVACETVCLAQVAPQAKPDVVQVQIVKGIPFSARAITESTQLLADGNRILRKNTAAVARDS